MEITMNDIIAFVDNAMSRNLGMEAHTEKSIYFPQISILKDRDNKINFVLKNKENIGYYLVVSCYNDYNNIALKDLSDTEIATFKLMCARVKEYSQNKLRSYFWNFFKEDEKSPTIDDLDSEDD